MVFSRPEKAALAVLMCIALEVTGAAATLEAAATTRLIQTANETRVSERDSGTGLLPAVPRPGQPASVSSENQSVLLCSQEKSGEEQDAAAGQGEQTPEHPWPPNLAELLGVQPISPEEPWRPPTAGPLTTFTAPITEKAHLVIQPFFFYNWERGSFDQNSDYQSLPDGQMEQSAVGSLFVQYGLLDNLEVDAQLFLQHNRSSEGGDHGSSTGLGDTLLIIRYNLLHETTSWAPEVSLLGQVKFPTGKFQNGDPDELGSDLMGTGSYDLTLGLDFTKAVRPLIFHADLWYSWPLTTTVDGVETKYGDYVNWNAAVEIPFWKEKLAFVLEFNGIHQADLEEDGAEVADSRMKSIMLGTGLELILSEEVQILLGYQRTLWGTNADAYDSVVGTLVWNL
jgi:hypothetical protein